MKRHNLFIVFAWAFWGLMVSLAIATIIRNSPWWELLVYWGWNVPLASSIVWNSYRNRKNRREIARLQRTMDTLERRPQG